MLRNLYYYLSPELRLFARKIYYLPMDILDDIRGKRQKNIPKRGDIFIGSGDFLVQGKSQALILKKYLDLESTDSVLDIGCGIGRTAFALKDFISKNGSYDGFDAMKQGIDWCNKNIHSEKQNFNFKYAPLRNSLYNNSKEDAAFFKFPYKNDQFDKVFLFLLLHHFY